MQSDTRLPSAMDQHRLSASAGQMDLPEATSSRNRGLPLDKDHPSVRLLRPSDPNSDLEHRGSLDATVTSRNGLAQPTTASPGYVPSVSPKYVSSIKYSSYYSRAIVFNRTLCNPVHDSIL